MKSYIFHVYYRRIAKMLTWGLIVLKVAFIICVRVKGRIFQNTRCLFVDYPGWLIPFAYVVSFGRSRSGLLQSYAHHSVHIFCLPRFYGTGMCFCHTTSTYDSPTTNNWSCRSMQYAVHLCVINLKKHYQSILKYDYIAVSYTEW